MDKLELVTDFSSLRQTDLVEVHCDHAQCGKKHRDILLKDTPHTDLLTDPYGHQDRGTRRGWALNVVCVGLGFPTGFNITNKTVARRIVYKVDTQLENTQETETKVTKKKPAKV